MPIVGGLDIHRKQLTFDYLDTVTGEVRRGQVAPADREHLRAWLARFGGGQDTDFALEGCTGWRYVAEELAAAGIGAHVGEPADTAAARGRKRHAKTDRTDSRHLRRPSRNRHAWPPASRNATDDVPVRRARQQLEMTRPDHSSHEPEPGICDCDSHLAAGIDRWRLPVVLAARTSAVRWVASLDGQSARRCWLTVCRISAARSASGPAGTSTSWNPRSRYTCSCSRSKTSESSKLICRAAVDFTKPWLGAVNLSGVRLCEGVPGLGRCRSPVPRSGRCGQADDLVPGGEAVGHLAAVLRCGEAVAAGSEVRRDRAEDREELLSPGG